MYVKESKKSINGIMLHTFGVQVGFFVSDFPDLVGGYTSIPCYDHGSLPSVADPTKGMSVGALFLVVALAAE